MARCSQSEMFRGPSVLSVGCSEREVVRVLRLRCSEHSESDAVRVQGVLRVKRPEHSETEAVRVF